jgi:uncharacterized protein YggE
MKNKIVVLSFCASLPFLSCVNNERKIEVSGTGKVTFVPDTVEMSIRVKNVNPKLNDSLSQTKDTILRLLDLCAGYGIAKEDIKSSYVNTDKEYDHPRYGETSKFIGYSASQSTLVTFRDLTKFEELSGAILALKITSMDAIHFTHSKLAEYESQADLLALDDAKNAAIQIAERMHVKLGDVLVISNTNTQNPDDGSMRYAAAYSKSLSSGIVLSPGILSVTRTVYTTFAIR